MPRLFDPSRPAALLRRCPIYAPTPLVRAEGLHLKLESVRLGLGAFKALGGAYAVARILSERTGSAPGPGIGRGMTFTCASAGNHGLSVAAGARLFGAGARVHLAASVAEGFAARLRRMGAEVVRSGGVYEEAVAAAKDDSATTGALYLADGAGPGDEERPRLVMEGYTVIAAELASRFGEEGT